jgi:hypothetical protein
MTIVDMIVRREGLRIASFLTVFAFFVLKIFSAKMFADEPKTTMRFRNKESECIYISFCREKVN